MLLYFILLFYYHLLLEERGELFRLNHCAAIPSDQRNPTWQTLPEE